MSGALELDVRGVKVPVDVEVTARGGSVPSAMFTARLADGQTAKARDVETLYKRLMDQFKVDLLELAIPVVIGGRKGELRRGAIVGVEGRSREPIVELDGGEKGQRSGYEVWIDPQIPEATLEEYNALRASIAELEGRCEAIVGMYQIDFRAKIRDGLIGPAIEAALEEG